jgi:hypothetical protein
VKLLLDHDADPSYSVSDLTGVFHGTSPIEPEKAIDVAYLQGFTRVVALLKNAEKAKFKQEERKIQEVFLDKVLEDFFENAEKEGQKEEKLAIDDIQLKKLSKELFIAAKIGNALRVENLLRQNVPATHIDTFSFLTPLSAAANTGSYKVVEVLLKNGVDPNYQYIPEGNTLGGPTALHALCRNNNIDGTRRIKIASLLLAHGARTDLPAFDPRIISRRDRQSPHYNHPADLVENCPELMELLCKTPTTNNSDQCLLSQVHFFFKRNVPDLKKLFLKKYLNQDQKKVHAAHDNDQQKQSSQRYQYNIEQMVNRMLFPLISKNHLMRF